MDVFKVVGVCVCVGGGGGGGGRMERSYSGRIFRGNAVPKNLVAKQMETYRLIWAFAVRTSMFFNWAHF